MNCPRCRKPGEFQHHTARNQHVPGRDIFRCLDVKCGTIWYEVNDDAYTKTDPAQTTKDGCSRPIA
jgi:hypothetical protein